MVAGVDELNVLDGFRLSDACRGNRDLGSVALEDRQWLFVDLQRDDALGADQAGAKRRAGRPRAFLGVEIKRDAAPGLIAGMDFVPDDQADAFVARMDVGLGRRTAFDEDGGLA